MIDNLIDPMLRIYAVCTIIVVKFEIKTLSFTVFNKNNCWY